MNTLIIDCSAGMNLVLVSNNKTYENFDNNQKKHSDELLLAVDNLLSQANISVKELNNICVCVGPGSFTGIRVAISICKGLSIGTGAKIFTASNFDIYSHNNFENSVYILDGFSEFIYTRIISNNIITDSCEKFGDVVESLKNKYTDYKIFSQSEKTKQKLVDNNIESVLVQNKMIDCFNEKISKDDVTEINQINPIYLRASQAEIERNEKLKEQK